MGLEYTPRRRLPTTRGVLYSATIFSRDLSNVVSCKSGRVAELADALGSGSSELTLMGVQVPPRPPASFPLPQRDGCPPDDTDDSFVELADEEAKRTDRRGWSDPRLRYIHSPRGNRSGGAGGGSSHPQRHAFQRGSRIQELHRDCDRPSSPSRTRWASGLTSLLMKPGNATRKDVQTKLDQFIQTSEELNQQAKDLKAPSALKEAHQWFAATMQLRARGLTNLKPSLHERAGGAGHRGVVGSGDARHAAAHALRRGLSGVLRGARHGGAHREEDLGVDRAHHASSRTPHWPRKTKVKEVLTTLKSSGDLQAVHGVELVKVVAIARQREIEADGTYNLTSSDKLAFKITVENSGNMTEKDVPVTLRLQAPSSTQPQLKTREDRRDRAKETMDDHHHRDHSHSLWRESAHPRQAGPVPNEKIEENNSSKRT